MSQLPFEVTLFCGREEFTTSFSPTLETARKVAKWHCDKAPINRAMVRDKASGHTESFAADGEDVVSETTGDILDECPGCSERDTVISELINQLKGEKLKYAALKREKENEMEESPEYDEVAKLFEFWKRTCGHAKSKLDFDRYRNVISILKSDGIELCARAIAGAAFQPHSDVRKNGTSIQYNDWELIFRNRTKYESFACRAPKDWKTIYEWKDEDATNP